ncbi:D-aminoacyl-tRNA deacylase, partial [Bacillus licheniformis]
MRLVVQCVTDADASVGGEIFGEIGHGVMVIVGVTHDDT